MQGIKCLAGERNAALMHMLADCMSQVACQTWGSEAGRWTGIVPHMQQFIASEDPTQVEVGLVLFIKLTEWMDQEALLQQNPGQMYDVLLRCMGHSSKQVQFSACKASISFVTVRPSLCAPLSDASSDSIVVGIREAHPLSYSLALVLRVVLAALMASHALRTALHCAAHCDTGNGAL